MNVYLNFRTSAGLVHAFKLFNPLAEQFDDAAGVYIVAASRPDNEFVPMYVGQCDSFKKDIPSNDRWCKAALMGANCVLLSSVPLQADRSALVEEMIAQLQPPLNLAIGLTDSIERQLAEQT
jgi:hypothetical protein